MTGILPEWGDQEGNVCLPRVFCGFIYLIKDSAYTRTYGAESRNDQIHGYIKVQFRSVSEHAAQKRSRTHRKSRTKAGRNHCEPQYLAESESVA